MSTIRTKALFKQVKELQETNKHYKAIELLKEILKLNPYNVNAYLDLGFSETETGQYREAIETYKKAHKLLPNNAEVFFRTGYCFLNCEELNEAENYFVKALQLNSNYLEAIEKLAEVYTLKGEDEKAKNLYHQYLSVNQSESRIVCALNELYLKAGDTSASLELLNSFLKLFPDSSEIIFSLARTYMQLNKYNEALNSLQHLINLEPSDSKALHLIGQIYFRSGNLKASLGFYNKALALNKNNPEFLYDIGIYYHHTGEYGIAESYFLEALALDSKNTRFLNDLGVNYLKQKKTDQAIETFIKVKVAEPDNKAVLNNLALAYTFKGDSSEAIRYYEEFLSADEAMDSGKDRAWLNLAKLYEKKKEFKKAIKAYENSANENGSEELFIKIAALALKEGDAAKALIYLQKVSEESTRVYLLLGKACYTLNEKEKALHYLSIVFEDEDNDLATLQELLKIYMSYNDYEKAAKINERILTLNLSDNNKVAAVNNLAGIYLASGKEQQALELLETISEKDNFNTWFNTGLAHYRLNDLRKALSFFEKAVSASDSVNALYYYIMTLIDLGMTEKAKTKLDKLQQLIPDSYLYYYCSSHLLEKEKNYNKAVQQLNKALESASTEPEVYIKLGRLYLLIEDFKNAESVFNEGLALFPGNTDLARETGKLKYQKNKIHETYLYFKNIFSTTKDEEIKTIYGICAYKLGHKEEAHEVLNSVIAINPRNTEALSFLARTYADKGSFLKAVEIIRDALVIEPSNILCLFTLGEIHEMNHQFEDAIWAYQKITAKVPDHFEAFKKTGDCHYKMKSYELAVKSYEIALDIFPGAYELLVNTALSYQETGDIIKAIECFEKYLHKVPGDIKVLGLLGIAWYLRENLTKAAEILDRYFWLTEKPEVKYLLTAGEIHHRLNDESKALEYYLKAMELEPDSYEALSRTGNLYYEKGEYRKAKEVFKNLLDKYPKVDDAKVLYTVTAYTTGQITEDEKKVYLYATDKDNRYFDPDWLFYNKKWSRSLILKIKEMLRELF